MAGPTATIAAIVPNCDYARYLPERLETIRRQDRAVDLLVFLDDASTDASWEVAQPLLAAFACPIIPDRNAQRSGAVLRQWRQGLARVGTDFVWIAEADDRAAPGLLAALAARLEADPSAIFAFCDSRAIDEAGATIATDSKDYYRAQGETVLDGDAVLEASEFLRRCLCPRNLVLNASAVLWRRTALAAALERIGTGLGAWTSAGDWRVYAEACMAGGHVHYLAAPLNDHRRHAGSVTGRVNAPQRYAEVVLMMAWLRQRIGAEPTRDGAPSTRDRAMRQHLADLRRAWMPDVSQA